MMEVLDKSVAEELYGNNRAVVVKPAMDVEIRPTIIQNFAGEVSLISVKDGKLTKQEYSTVRLVIAECEALFDTKPLVFEKGWIVGSNGHDVGEGENKYANRHVPF